MRSTGYQPPQRIGRRGRSESIPSDHATIGLLMLDDSPQAHPTMALAKLNGVQKEIGDSQLNLVVARVDADAEPPSWIHSRQVAGLLLWGLGLPAHVAEAIGSIPSVWLSSHADASGYRILEGNYEVGRVALNYLRRRGARSLAFICPPTRFVQQLGRGEAFVRLAQAAGLPVHQLVESGDPDVDERETLDRLIDRMLGLTPPPDGLFLPEDRYAPIVYQALRRRGVEPGRDLPVIACNNERTYLDGLNPRPATIDLAPELTGRLAVEQLLWQIRSGAVDRHVDVVVEPKLIEGDVT